MAQSKGTLRIRLECLVMAEGVEKVRTSKFCATIVRASGACCNIDSTKSQILKHCFKNLERPDFFNSLNYYRPFQPTLQHDRCWL